ncbi:MAG: YbaK/EbsC family protein [Pelagibacteraceae bacterium]
MLDSKYLAKPSIKKIKEILDKENIKIIDLGKSGHTAKMAAESLKVSTNRICKSLILKSDNEFILCLINGDDKASFDKIKSLKKSNSLRMANADEVKDITGISIGGVSPVGLKNNLNCLIDQKIETFDTIFCAAGAAELVFEIKPFQLKKITNGSFENIT